MSNDLKLILVYGGILTGGVALALFVPSLAWILGILIALFALHLAFQQGRQYERKLTSSIEPKELEEARRDSWTQCVAWFAYNLQARISINDLNAAESANPYDHEWDDLKQ